MLDGINPLFLSIYRYYGSGGMGGGGGLQATDLRRRLESTRRSGTTTRRPQSPPRSLRRDASRPCHDATDDQEERWLLSRSFPRFLFPLALFSYNNNTGRNFCKNFSNSGFKRWQSRVASDSGLRSAHVHRLAGVQTAGREEGGWRGGGRRVEEVVERRIRRNRFVGARGEDLWRGSGREEGRKEREEASASMASRGFTVDRGRGNEDPPPRHRAFRYARYVSL